MVAASFSGFPPSTKVLVVDDNTDLLVTIANALGKVDAYEVEVQGDPQVALRRLSEMPFDLFLLDIRMPEVDGISLLRHCRRLQPNAPVILMTAYATVEQAVDLMRLGADYYLSKPFSPDSLRDVVARVLGACQRSASPSPSQRVFMTKDPATQGVLALAEAAAGSDAPVLIQGESGTGKELLARYIHLHSNRSAGPMEVVNSAAMPEALVEAMLFGYEKDAFAGAAGPMPGRVEVASGGTLFLDEVGDMSLPAQAKVLGALQDKTFHRLGDSGTRTADVRYIFATNRNLGRMIAERSFREDLYYRIGVVELTLPPLRHRPADVELLTGIFLARFAGESHAQPPVIDGAAMEVLRRELWPGNVRQLENFCQRVTIFAPAGANLTPDQVRRLLINYSSGAQTNPNASGPAHHSRENILRALSSTNGNITKAAALLGVSRPTIYSKLKKFGIESGPEKTD